MLDTGHFSRMARVSKRTLRYYDSIDLFKPMQVNPDTGVRYYSAKQMSDLNRILALKELGLSLDQIRRMLDENISHDEIHGMLMLKKAEAEQAVLANVQRFRSIESRIQNPELYFKQGIVLKPVPKQAFLSYRRFVKDEDDFRAMNLRILNQAPELSDDIHSHFTVIIHGDDLHFDDGHLDVEMGFLVPVSTGLKIEISQDCVLKERLLPAVKTMVCVVLDGGPSRYPAGFAAIAKWIEDNNYKVTGAQREIVLEMPYTGDESEMVIELQFPVERLISDTRQFLSKTKSRTGETL